MPAAKPGPPDEGELLYRHRNPPDLSDQDAGTTH
jgi:hypothetical protein